MKQPRVKRVEQPSEPRRVISKLDKSKLKQKNDQDKPQRSITKIDKTIMDNFYKLVHSQPSIRHRAGISTLKILNTMNKNKNPSIFNENLNYCVNRLVCGLASARGFAMHGYGVLLLKLLNIFQISTERLLSIAQENFGQISKKNESLNLVGHLLLISIILESGNHEKSKANAQFVPKIEKELIELYNCKSYFSTPVSKIAMEHHKVFPELFQKFYQEVLKDKQFFKVNKILCNAHPDILMKYLNDLMTSMHNHPSQQDCIKQIDHIVRRPQLLDNMGLVNKTCKFLILNYLFKSKKESPQNELLEVEGDIPKVNRISPKTRISFRSSYHSTMHHLISICKSVQRLEQLDDIVGFVAKLMENNELRLEARERDKIVQDFWPNFNALHVKLKQLLEKEKESNELNPIATIFLFYGLQIVEHGLECKSQLEELLECCERKEMWADIVTDQLIAILSATECSPWIRKLCENVFGCLLPNITEESITLICEAIKSFGQEDDEDGEEFDDEDSNDESDTDSEEDEQMDVEDDLKMNTNDIESQQNEKAAEHDEKIQISEDKSKDSDKKGLGSDDDEEDEEYFDDEKMMALDSIIANTFKLNRKKNKRDPSLQLRCIDLLKKLITKKDFNADHKNAILSTLIPLAIKCRKMKETKPVFDKVLNVLSKMPGKSKFPAVEQFIEKFK